ncbi:hypothetical protein [Acidihalobacter ferrooxydans]|uniref:Uncharacterized protein n=1 Tax=Acidihalobacter ferrooxydans TaxID=1765967 RepID=A0A1P8UFK0_9GAMM|nr:hypothetical protein [Acidihalobacter ferrooxydans]APZ42615.1 hypothetical protein BW247_05480 [Acidihalobacter ferrooxydans]
MGGILNATVIETDIGLREPGVIHPFSLPHEVGSAEEWTQSVRNLWRKDPGFRQYALMIAHYAAEHPVAYRGPYAEQARATIEALIKRNKNGR